MNVCSGSRDAPIFFRKENPYLETPDGLGLAQRLLAEGKLQAAILALEAEVMKHPNSSEGWRLLGECHADNEQVNPKPYTLATKITTPKSNREQP